MPQQARWGSGGELIGAITARESTDKCELGQEGKIP